MYGIKKSDIIQIDEKMEYQKKYILNRFFDFGFDEQKSILDFTYSANLNPKKYFAEMNNRVNSIFEYAKSLNLKPVFATITAPSKFHQTDRKRNLLISPNETAQELTQIFNKFTNLQIFQKMKKNLGRGLIYFRVYEPHKSGVPHMHIMMFLPKDYILEVKNKFYNYFTDRVRWGNNRKSLDFKYTFYNKNSLGDTTGGAIAYMMKYITKTFRNEDDKSTQYAFYWYVKHRVRRFLTSRTLAPLEVYRKVRYFFANKYEYDYLRVTELLKNSNIIKLFDGTTINYMFYNHDTCEVEEINLWQKNADLILHSRIKTNQTFKLKYEKKEYEKPLVAFVSTFEKYMHDKKSNKFVLMPVVPSMLSDYQLENYYKNLNHNFENLDNLIHYGMVKNEMIERGFLNEEYIKPNLYDLNDLNFDDVYYKKEKLYSHSELLEIFKKESIESNKEFWKGRNENDIRIED
ncbi:replication endonuclease [Arcobacter porcinus]|uniref:Putative phage replication protein n=1 Tax=Arcobacter porcinus TaxID=1935204 RepID=A0A5C2HJ15_9BACT|nr:replication endonuclease [Arcobacter porcinus]OCL91386.1 Bacteriophage replication protein A (GPA) [Aliarcobacter thereius]QEP40298.1 putative phage replication protein [Arcobacter porcinus]